MPETRTTLGKILVNEALPEDLRDRERVFSKKSSKEFFQQLAEKHPDKYIDVLKKLSDISRVVATDYGGSASTRLLDLKIPPKTKAYRNEIRDRIKKISQDPTLSYKEKDSKIVRTMVKAMPTIEKTLLSELSERKDNSYGIMVKQGLRGSGTQLSQLIFGDMLVSDHRDRPVPIPGLHGYAEGVTGPEFWAGSYASRKGYADVQFATAKTGYLGKQLAAMAQNLRITAEDCGSKGLGLLVDSDDPEIIGSVLAKDHSGMPANTAIDKKNMAKLKEGKVLVRSLLTCQMPEGVCQKCSGKRNQNKFPEMGAYIGIESARVLSEPMTQQLALSAKHIGGLGTSGNVLSDDISGFDEVNQFVQVPKVFKGGAVLAQSEGKVTRIEDAPQGGKYVYVGDALEYVPATRSVSVKVGENVELGDILSDGTPNPSDIGRLKGLGEGRRYFQDTFTNILNKNGVPSHRRNIEVLSRAFFDKVEITNPDGLLGYNISDIVPYAEIQKNYSPRPLSQDLSPHRSLGMYLEKPALHYSIGTRITNRVAKELEDNNISAIKVNKKEPDFKPYVVRAMDVLGSDPDWKVRLSGFGLKKSFLDAARRGSSSKVEGLSYVPKLMDPSRL